MAARLKRDCVRLQNKTTYIKNIAIVCTWWKIIDKIYVYYVYLPWSFFPVKGNMPQIDIMYCKVPYIDRAMAWSSCSDLHMDVF